MTRRQWIWTVTCGLLLLAGIALWVKGPAALAGARAFWSGRGKDFDIVGMLKDVDKTNTQIIKANNDLIQSLEGVKQQAGAVSGVYGRLQNLETGLGDQAAVLSRLNGLTRDQADLSLALERLTASVAPSTERLAKTAGQQAQAVESMGKVTNSMVGRMGSISDSNKSTAAKLWRAEELSAKVLTEMP